MSKICNNDEENVANKRRAIKHARISSQVNNHRK